LSSSQKYERCSDWKRFRTSPPSRSSSSGCVLQRLTHCCTERLAGLFEGGEGRGRRMKVIPGSSSTVRGTPHSMRACTTRRGVLHTGSNGNGIRGTRSRWRRGARRSSSTRWRGDHGTRHGTRSLSLIRKTGAVHPVGYSMDKAYDSEEIRRVVVEERRGGGSSVCDSAQAGKEPRAERTGAPHVRSSMRSCTTGGTWLRRCFL